MVLNKKLKELRTKKGLTQAEFAKLLDINPKVVSKWENGESLPQSEMLPLIADIFNISIDELFERICTYNIDSKAIAREYGYEHAYSIGDIQSMVSYLILGMQERQNRDMGCYSDEALADISDDLQSLIEVKDERPQCYSYSKSDSVVNYMRNDFIITTLWQCDERKSAEILNSNYRAMRTVFEFFALEGAEKILAHFLSLANGSIFTFDHLVESAGVDEATAKRFIELLFSLNKTSTECVINEETAVINGVDTKICTYYEGHVTKMLKTILLTAYLLTEQKGGFR